MKIDVTFEEANESFDVRFHNVSVDPKSVKSVNGITPDEIGNVQVSSTCELEQPVWGKGSEEILVSMGYDGRSGFHAAMSREEYDVTMAKCTRASLISGNNGEEIAEIPLSWVHHDEAFDLNLDGELVPCIGVEVEYDTGRERVVLWCGGITQIPGEYTGLGDVAAALDHIIALQEAVIG